MTRKIEQDTNPNGKYGFISMVAMIIGIVVASGIFVKNSEIIIGTSSAILTTIAWIVGGLIVLCMMMGFLEITSSSRLKKEQGTILNWSRNFLGKNAAMVIGYYITFLYIPLLTIGLSFFAANFLLQGIGLENISLLWGFIFITVVGILFMFFAQIVNGLTSKPGKIFQTTGTFIKLIPLFALILIAFIAITASLSGIETNAVFDPTDDINNIDGKGINDENGAGHYIALIFAVLPGILFSFDGFLYADSLSLEAKKETTYKKALIFSIIFIVIIYILFSLSTMTLAGLDAEGEYAFDTKSIFETVFPIHGKTIGTVVVILIMISVLVAVNGLATVSSRNLADASHQNLIKDENGVLLRRNHSEAPYNAAFKIFIFMIMFAFILRAGDAIMINWSANGEKLKYADLESGKDLQLTGIATSLSAVFMFFMYGLILMGGVVNRFTKKVTVQKSFGFIFFAIVAMIFMIASAGYFLWDIFLQDIVWIANGSLAEGGSHYGIISIKNACKELIAMVFFLTILIGMWIGVFAYNYNHIKEANFSNYPNKINARKTYDALISYKDYEKAVYSKSNFSTLIDHPEKLDYEWFLEQQIILDKKIIHEKEKLHIRSFLPLKFQEKLAREKNANNKKIKQQQVNQNDKFKTKNLTDLKKEKVDGKIKENNWNQLLKLKIKDFQEKTTIQTKKSLIKIQNKTEELKKVVNADIIYIKTTLIKIKRVVNAKFVYIKTILSKDKKDQQNEELKSKKGGTVLNKPNNLKKEELSTNKKNEIKNLKTSQDNKDLQLEKKDQQSAKESPVIKIQKNEVEEKETYKANKQILKEANFAKKEALQAKKEKQKAELNLGKIKIKKGFNELKNNLLAEGIDFNLKSSKSELQQIAKEYISISEEQLDLRFSKFTIKINNLKSKAQKYNLLKEFKKADIQNLKEQLDYYKITYKEDATKGELFSLLKNH